MFLDIVVDDNFDRKLTVIEPDDMNIFKFWLKKFDFFPKKLLEDKCSLELIYK